MRLTYHRTNVNEKWMQDLVLKRMMIPKSVLLKRLVNGGKNGEWVARKFAAERKSISAAIFFYHPRCDGFFAVNLFISVAILRKSFSKESWQRSNAQYVILLKKKAEMHFSTIATRSIFWYSRFVISIKVLSLRSTQCASISTYARIM